jgi:diguanylate cyclase (GGDEF)-like protein
VDSLTGSANRGRFNDFIAEQFEATQTSGIPLSVLFLDADHFKDFNDTYGHPVGDKVLTELATLLRQKMPADSLVARYGGEEFAVVLPNVERREAARLAEDFRSAMSELPIESEDGQLLYVTVSVGVATAEKGCFEQPRQLLKAADQGVYAAKNAGRNCVRIFAPKVASPAA